MINANTIEVSNIQDAKEFYDERSPEYVGRLVMSQADAMTMPISLENVYLPAIKTLNDSPHEALKFADTFGKLSINVALDNQETSFTLAPAKNYPPGNIAEIKTTRKFGIDQLFSTKDVDAAYMYLLSQDVTVTPELGLIQALHMLDYALISRQFDGKMPIVRSVSNEDLQKLQKDNPSVYIRTYGNVRNLSEAPTVLGTVVPTTLVERNGISLTQLAGAPINKPASSPRPEREQEAATIIGITTAKQPHIGHGFLFTKAIAEANRDKSVILELNDRGPRVARAVATLAQQQNQSTEKTIEAISTGVTPFEVIQKAYRARDNNADLSLPQSFKLALPNAMYRELFQRITPKASTLHLIADSDKLMQEAMEELSQDEAAKPLFGGSGMTLYGTGDRVAVIEAGSEPTVIGIFGALATRYELTIVDSPFPMSKAERNALQSGGLKIQLVEGIGLSIDFQATSGTKGNAPTLEKVTNMLGNLDSSLLPAVLRQLLQEAIFIKSGCGGSLCPNYASVDYLLVELEQTIASFDETQTKDLLHTPFKFDTITRSLSRDFLSPIYTQYATKGKAKVGEITALCQQLPALSKQFSSKILNTVAAMSNQPDMSVPSGAVLGQDIKLLNSLRCCNTKTVFELLDPGFDMQLYKSKTPLARTKIEQVMLKMGYNLGQEDVFIKKLVEIGDLYVLC